MIQLKIIDKFSYISNDTRVTITPSFHWEHKSEKVYVIEVWKTKSIKDNVGLFPDYDEAKKVVDVIKSIQKLNLPVSDVVTIPVRVYKDLYEYIKYKGEHKISISYVDWCKYMRRQKKGM